MNGSGKTARVLVIEILLLAAVAVATYAYYWFRDMGINFEMGL